MAFLDKLIGMGEIDEMRRQADEVARARFNPNILNPQLEEAQTVAQEGIADDEVRNQLLNRIFGSSTDSSVLDMGAGSGRTMAFLNRMNKNRGAQIASAETNIALQEERAKREGRAQAADIQSKRNQMMAEREATMKQNQLRAQAEASKRKKQLGATVGKLAGTVAGGFLGPAGAALGGAAGGALFGGAGGAATGAISGFTAASGRERQEEVDQEMEDFRDRLLERLDRLQQGGARNIIPDDTDFLDNARMMGLFGLKPFTGKFDTNN